jgi:hypothetical protein
MGQFTFIDKFEEIERKVIESVSKTKLEYLIVTEAKILNQDDDVMLDLSLILPEPIVPGSIYNFKTFF